MGEDQSDMNDIIINDCMSLLRKVDAVVVTSIMIQKDFINNLLYSGYWCQVIGVGGDGMSCF